jgi:hypothetical protein
MSIDTNTRFLGVDSSKVDLVEKKDRINNAKTEYYSLQDIYGYINPLVGLFSQTTSSTPVANTTTESSLIGVGVGSLSVPANAFKVGDSYHAKLIGHISCNASAALRFKIKAGSLILADTGIINLNAITDRHWEINVYFTIRTIGSAGTASIASGGIFSYTKNSGLNFEGTNFSIVNDDTFDTTISNTLDVTAQWGSANAADSIYSEIFTLSKTF